VAFVGLGGLRDALVRHSLLIGLALSGLAFVVASLAIAAGLSAFAYAAALVGLGGLVSWGATWCLYSIAVARPLAGLQAEALRLANKEVTAFSDALAAVCEGDLTRKIEIEPSPINLLASCEVTHRPRTTGLDRSLQARARLGPGDPALGRRPDRAVGGRENSQRPKGRLTAPLGVVLPRR
jgi:hypothetical protein